MPEFSVSQSDFSFDLLADAYDTTTFMIENTGGGVLSWSLSGIDYTDNVSFGSSGDTISHHDSVQYALVINAVGTTLDTYLDTIVITTNDPAQESN